MTRPVPFTTRQMAGRDEKTSLIRSRLISSSGRMAWPMPHLGGRRYYAVGPDHAAKREGNLAVAWSYETGDLLPGERKEGFVSDKSEKRKRRERSVEERKIKGRYLKTKE